MKLANLLTIRLIKLLLFVLAIWSVIYFLMQMHEIYDDIDEGLTNLKQEFIVQANRDSAFVDNMVIYNPINMKVEEISQELALSIKEEHQTIDIYFETENEYEEVRILSTAFKCEANGKFYSLKLFTSTVESDDLIENMLILLIFLWISVGLIMFLGGRFIIDRSSKPFYQLLKDLENFNLNNTQMIEIPKTNIAEFKALNKSIEQLLKENIEAYKQQKIFIENASHELQTPIAIIISRIELMMNNENASETQLSEFATILANLNRMKRLNSSLLLLSKIQNKQFVEHLPIEISNVIEDVCCNFRDIIEHRELELSIEKSGNPIVRMNTDLAHILISNLVKNAINYNISKGKIVIEITSHSFSIANDGAPIDEGVNIFDRYTSSNTNNSSSTGLGLSIVSSIANIYNFKINYSYNGMHQIAIHF